MDKGLDIEWRRCCLALHKVLGARPDRLRELITDLRQRTIAGVTAGELLRQTEGMARRNSVAADWKAAESALQWLAPGRELLLITDPTYPPALREISAAPPLLFVAGDPSVLGRPQLALVGSRKATASGLETATWLANGLALQGFSITSGLAHGIDTAAHRGALSACGTTIAVLATGIDRTYPQQNRDLAEKISSSGALVSEFSLGAAPVAFHFPRRNRVISGLTLGTVVVEATLKSGSLITARYALEQGREVFAVPSSIRNSQAEGCHALLKQGACLVTSPADILEGLPAHLVPSQTKHMSDTRPMTESTTNSIDGPDAVRVISSLGFEPLSMDHLAASTGLTIHSLSSILLRLELEGYVRSLPGGYFERADGPTHTR